MKTKVFDFMFIIVIFIGICFCAINIVNTTMNNYNDSKKEIVELFNDIF